MAGCLVFQHSSVTGFCSCPDLSPVTQHWSSSGAVAEQIFTSSWLTPQPPCYQLILSSSSLRLGLPVVPAGKYILRSSLDPGTPEGKVRAVAVCAVPPALPAPVSFLGWCLLLQAYKEFICKPPEGFVL